MKLSIKTPARLHLGLIDLNGNLGRLYGSIGVAIDRPNIALEAESREKLKIAGLEKDRVANAVQKFSEYYGINPKIGIDVKASIPQHAGLGSGTQLCLAVGTALALVHGIKASTREIASVMSRGFVSGIGVGCFERGGFMVDGGLNVLYQTPPQQIFHAVFPKDWAYVIAIPVIKKGLSGRQENNAFRQIIPGPVKNAQEISRLVLMKMLPSLLEQDIEGFGYALTEIDRKTGEYYRDIPQDKTRAKIIKHMIGAGAYGAGQSSWGPAVYGLTDKGNAASLEAEAENFLKENKIKGKVFTAQADNRGAVIRKS
jgi:beta-RFAP synthase